MHRFTHAAALVLLCAGSAAAQDAPSRASCTLDVFCPGEDATCDAADPVSFEFDSAAPSMALGGEALAVETVMGDAAGLVLISAATAEAPLVHAVIDAQGRAMIVVSSGAGDSASRPDGRYLGSCEGS